MSEIETQSFINNQSEKGNFKRLVSEKPFDLGVPPEKKARENGTHPEPESPDKNGNTTVPSTKTNGECMIRNNTGGTDLCKQVVHESSKKNTSSETQRNQTFANHHAKDHLVKAMHQKNHQPILKSPKKRLSDLMYIEHYENGGGYILHAYQDELVRLDKSDLEAFVLKYYKTLFNERTKKNIPVEFANYCIGIVHGAAEPMPDLLHYMAQNYSQMSVKSNAMEAKNDIVSLTMKDYAANVYKFYSCGLYRYGPLHAVSVVGTKGEETGTYCSDVIKMLEKHPFLGVVLPWGELSHLKGMKARKSDDGPILWTRPGEQCIPTKMTPMKRKPKMNVDSGGMVGNLPVFGRGAIPRSTFIPDRTPCHADHADDGLLRHSTAAVGVLKAVHPKGKKSSNAGRRIVKDAVLFDPRHYYSLIQRLQLDIMEPPASQCGSYWAEDAELNQLRVEGYTYVRVHLRDDDIYFIPRNTVHQFKTVSAVTSVAWHVRLKSYYKDEQKSTADNTPVKTEQVKSQEPESLPTCDLTNIVNDCAGRQEVGSIRSNVKKQEEEESIDKKEIVADDPPPPPPPADSKVEPFDSSTADN